MGLWVYSYKAFLSSTLACCFWYAETCHFGDKPTNPPLSSAFCVLWADLSGVWIFPIVSAQLSLWILSSELYLMFFFSVFQIWGRHPDGSVWCSECSPRWNSSVGNPWGWQHMCQKSQELLPCFPIATASNRMCRLTAAIINPVSVLKGLSFLEIHMHGVENEGFLSKQATVPFPFCSRLVT